MENKTAPLPDVRLSTMVRYVELATERLDELQTKLAMEKDPHGMKAAAILVAAKLLEDMLGSAATVIKNHLPRIFENYPTRLGKNTSAYKRLADALFNDEAGARNDMVVRDAFWRMRIGELEYRKAKEASKALEDELWDALKMG